tara:strand:+ start:370 stop:846 length:477 start_codon:yes stop_codon:yes gene_type:complete
VADLKFFSRHLAQNYPTYEGLTNGSMEKIWVYFVEDLPANDQSEITDFYANLTAQDVSNYGFEKIVYEAADFGAFVINDFSAENVKLGITQAGLTKSVLVTCSDLLKACQTGSLYLAIEEAKAIPDDKKDDIFLTDARILKYVNMIEKYLDIELSVSL